MPLSNYHQKQANQSDEEINHKAEIKEQELISVFDNISLNTIDNLAQIAVLGCGDKRYISHHKRIFEEILMKDVEITTFDITTEHLTNEEGVVRHDCTNPIPDPPYDIIYSHVLLKFIETGKQFDLLKNSFEALKQGGVAIHIFDREEIEIESPLLPSGLWSVPLDRWKILLTKSGIEHKEILLPYGSALVLLRK